MGDGIARRRGPLVLVLLGVIGCAGPQNEKTDDAGAQPVRIDPNGIGEAVLSRLVPGAVQEVSRRSSGTSASPGSRIASLGVVGDGIDEGALQRANELIEASFLASRRLELVPWAKVEPILQSARLTRDDADDRKLSRALASGTGKALDGVLRATLSSKPVPGPRRMVNYVFTLTLFDVATGASDRVSRRVRKMFAVGTTDP